MGVEYPTFYRPPARQLIPPACCSQKRKSTLENTCLLVLSTERFEMLEEAVRILQDSATAKELQKKCTRIAKEKVGLMRRSWITMKDGY